MYRIHCVATMFALAFLSTTSAAQTDPLVACADFSDGVGIPEYKGTAGTEDGDVTILCRLGYLLEHNNNHKVPDWVMERLTPERLQDVAKRKDNFRADPDLPEGKRSELDDYNGSGFDRGHMAPAADMKFSAEAMNESFLLSNMAPQVGIGFNRHIWADLEADVREWAERRKDLVVITGPVYGTKTIGANKVAVPTHFFKIAYEPSRNRAIAFLLPNKKIKGNDLKPYLTSVDEIEELTGFDFFPDVSNARQRRVEKNVSSLWEQ